MEAVLGNDETIDSLVTDILDHYENYRENLLTGKAMIVAYSRPIAMKIYNRILQLRPSWGEKVAVVMTESNKDPEQWRKIIGNKHHKEELAKKFKDNNSPLKIAIVVDMWLTGFDVPRLQLCMCTSLCRVITLCRQLQELTVFSKTRKAVLSLTI